MEDLKLVLVSAVALVREDGCLLLAQRPEGKSLAGLWEFPGGKVEEGESPEFALVRELKEELGIDVDTQDFVPFSFASHTYETFHLLMPVFLCRKWQGEPKGCEGQSLAWVTANDLVKYPTPPADVGLMDEFRRWTGDKICGEQKLDTF
ncbi:8-oxo-dGTP diphosphatase MutT [Hirschia litorea]|uniref:8-oxo-dGTP diphosphatase n=1 Tax=Hirschia litorea TaxID=1199156 RepID=A0ABW2IK90_9PROT